MNDKIGVIITISQKSLHLITARVLFRTVSETNTKMMKLAMENAEIKELSLLLQNESDFLP